MKALRAVMLVMLFCVVFHEPARAEIPELSGSQIVDQIIAAKGKVVLVNFFAPWCAPCAEEIPALARLRKAYSADEVLIIGVSIDDDMAELEKFIRKYSINYQVIIGATDVFRYYRVNAIPHNVVYNREGKLVANQIGLVEEKQLRNFIDKLVKEK
jgi:thiol-disulfide isomerase/thioredoxin